MTAALIDRLERELLGTGASTGSGPVVGALFQRVLALVFCDAWLSLLRQLGVLIGSRGLAPWAPVSASLREQAVPFWDYPTLLRHADSDGALRAVALLGLGLCVLALLGIVPRTLLPLSGALYVSFIFAGASFFHFQWDNLITECALLVVFLPADRPRRWAHVLFRLLLFKLYWESGLAKYQSSLHDWQDGSAMTFYYETAPLPAWPAWFAHHLPVAWHNLESWSALGLELVIPFFIFGPRPLRLIALVALTGFQVLNLATANYGFFVYLALALHLFLLDDADIPEWLRRALRLAPPRSDVLRWLAPRVVLGVAISMLYIAVSVIEGLDTFTAVELPGWAQDIAGLQGRVPLVNTYHLFGSITRERLEPQLETEADDGTWTEHDLWHKPGDVHRHPDFVAPHQPRVDFLLWFYGLSARQRPPGYVATLLHRLCDDPAAVQPLFRDALPAHPRAARIRFWRYHFSTWEELWHQGAWWQRQLEMVGPTLRCQ